MTSVEAIADPIQPRLSISAIVALAGGAVVLALHLTVRVFGAVSSELDGSNYNSALFLQLGVLGLLSFLPIAAVIALGHVGFVATKPGRKRGRTLSRSPA